MKKIIFLFVLIFSSFAFAQNFTIRSLPDRTSGGGLATSDRLIMSLGASDSYYDFSLLELFAFMDDQAWTWTANHNFNGAITTVNGRLTIGTDDHLTWTNDPTPLYVREVYPKAQFLCYSGTTRYDTLMSLYQFSLGTNTIYGDWTFASGASITFNNPITYSNSVEIGSGSSLLIDNSASFNLGTGYNGTLGGSLYKINLSRDLIGYTNNDVGGLDTIPSYYYLRQNYAALSGATYSGAHNFGGAAGLTLPSSINTTLGSIGYFGGDGSSQIRFNYGTGGTDKDTIPSLRSLRAGSFTWNGAQTWNGLNKSGVQSTALSAGSQTVALTELVLNLTGNVTPSSITNFTGGSEGMEITIFCNRSGTYGFSIADDDTNIELINDVSSISLTPNDIVKFLKIGTTWYQVTPVATN